LENRNSYLGVKLAKKLLQYIKKRNLLPGYPNLRLVAEVVIERIISEIEKGELKPIGELEDFIFVQSQEYIKRIASRLFLEGRKLRDVIQLAPIKLILIIGAGFSFEAGMPLTRHLSLILKPMGFDFKGYEDIKEAFRKISQDKEKDKEFKERFILYLKEGLQRGEIKITEAHEIVIKKFGDDKILEILCLNWDNLLEICYKKLTGNKILKINRENVSIQEDTFLHCLWKFHGDVDDPDYEWIYPGTKGRVFSNFKKYLEFLIKQRKYTLCGLVVGYSELDEEMGNVIEMIEKSFVLFRVGMDMRLFNKHKNYILAPARWILPQIFSDQTNNNEK
jgi:hypothetical protein